MSRPECTRKSPAAGASCFSDTQSTLRHPKLHFSDIQNTISQTFKAPFQTSRAPSRCRAISRHIQDSQGQILAVAFRRKSFKRVKLFPLRSRAERQHAECLRMRRNTHPKPPSQTSAAPFSSRMLITRSTDSSQVDMLGLRYKFVNF